MFLPGQHNRYNRRDLIRMRGGVIPDGRDAMAKGGDLLKAIHEDHPFDDMYRRLIVDPPEYSSDNLDVPKELRRYKPHPDITGKDFHEMRERMRGEVRNITMDSQKNKGHNQPQPMESVLGWNHTFQAGDLVMYNSTTKGWIPAQVLGLCRGGMLHLDVKKFVSADRLRFRKDPLEIRREREKALSEYMERLKLEKPNEHKQSLDEKYSNWEKYSRIAVSDSEAENVREPPEFPLLDGFRAQCKACNGLVNVMDFKRKSERQEWGLSQLCASCQRQILFNKTLLKSPIPGIQQTGSEHDVDEDWT